MRRYSSLIAVLTACTLVRFCEQGQAHGGFYVARSSSLIRPYGTAQHFSRSEVINRSNSRKKAVVSLDASRALPCCKDESGGAICRAMKSNDLKGFASRCATEPDFSLVVCCKACSELGSNYRERAANFFSVPNNSTNCFDRMSAAYCSRFQAANDSWTSRRWSCDTDHFRVGFRVCRSTCGFCSIDWKNAPEPLKCP